MHRDLDKIDVLIIDTSFHEFRKGAPEIHQIIAAMADLRYRCYEILDHLSKPNPQASIDVL